MDLLQMENIITTQLMVRVPNTVIGYTSDTPPKPIYIKDKYPHISFTNEITEETPSFPNVYIHELEPSEVGNSIPNDTIHALRDTIQIEVTTNVSKTDSHIVINACIKAMKALRFSLVTGPLPSKTNNLHRYIIRMRRTVANGDVF